MRDLTAALGVAALAAICCGGPLLLAALVGAGLGATLAPAAPLLAVGGLVSAGLLGVVVVRRSRRHEACAARVRAPREEMS
ncbi:MAG: hypothetical protein ACRDY6_08790 [Acidimicrobiia bacterium]